MECICDTNNFNLFLTMLSSNFQSNMIVFHDLVWMKPCIGEFDPLFRLVTRNWSIFSVHRYIVGWLCRVSLSENDSSRKIGNLSKLKRNTQTSCDRGPFVDQQHNPLQYNAMQCHPSIHPTLCLDLI